jgi:hypothetical protein
MPEPEITTMKFDGVQTLMKFNDVQTLMKFIKTENIKFISKYDEICFLANFNNNFNNNAVKRIDGAVVRQHGVNVYTFEIHHRGKYGLEMNKCRITTYPDGYTYLTNGAVFTATNDNRLIMVDEPNTDYNFALSLHDNFKFIRLNNDITIPHFNFFNQIIRMVSDTIVRHLTSLGFAAEREFHGDGVDITIRITEEKQAVCNFLVTRNWKEILKPFKNIISILRIKIIDKTNDVYTYDVDDLFIRFNSRINNKLSMTFKVEDDNLITIKLIGESAYTVYEINKLYSETEEYDGWSFMPQLKPFYTDSKWCRQPIYEFKVYGKKQFFKVHENYLPIMNLGILRIDGFRINGIDYRYDVPQYCNSLFEIPNTADWNTYAFQTVSNKITNE